jgi:hypothetical protein
MLWCSLLLVTGLLATACRSVPRFETIDDAREALAEADIGCEQFSPDPPIASACSFHESVPQDGNAIGVFVIYRDASEARSTYERCSEPPDDNEGQLLYRDGEAWLASIAAVADDRVTNSDIEDQAFVRRIADLLGAEIVDC